MAGRPKAQIKLNAAEREQLQAWARRRKTAQALALRSRIVLACAAGVANQDVASELECTRQTVSKWPNRFAQLRLAGLFVCRAENQTPSTRSDPANLALGPGPAGTTHPRLRPSWHHHAVCGARCGDRRGDGAIASAAWSQRVSAGHAYHRDLCA